jgi:DNA-binding NarL/FixJ family response regulator
VREAAYDVCQACGAVRVVRPGVAKREATREVTAPERVVRALRLIDTLTPQERNTFELLGLGYGNRAIARTFKISEGTVKCHVTAILSKLQLESRLQAGLAALVLSPLASPGGGSSGAG